MSITRLPTYGIYQIMQDHPDGCFVYMFDWDVSKTRCRRNTLPVFVKPIDVVYPSSSNPNRTHKVLYKHRLNGVRQTELPIGSYHVATSEVEALENYEKLVKHYSDRRINWLEDEIKSSETYVQTLKTKAAAHRVK